MARVFSFCIYGPPNPKYYTGMTENIQIIEKHFPGWGVIIYVGADVPAGYVRTLSSYSNVVLRETGIVGHKNSVYRFFAIDEPWVDLMLVRDADSRVHWRDRWAIRSFLSSGYAAHIIRDHFYHAEYILAGLWGIRKNTLGTSIRTLYDAWTPVSAGSGDQNDPHGFGIDQNFLKLEVYPKIKKNAFITFSNNRLLSGETGVEFPFAWNPNIYCGMVEDVNFLNSIDLEPQSAGLRLPKASVRINAASDVPPNQPASVAEEIRELPRMSQSSTAGVLNFLNKK